MGVRTYSLFFLVAGALLAQEPEERDVSLKTIGPNILHDQASIWTFPAKVVRGRHVLPTVAVLGITGGLIAADPYTGRFFRRHEDSFSGLNEHLTETVGTAGSLGTPAVFYLTGLIRKDRYMPKHGTSSGGSVGGSGDPESGASRGVPAHAATGFRA